MTVDEDGEPTASPNRIREKAMASVALAAGALVSFTVHGSDWSPWLTPAALVLLAAVAVVWALRGIALRIVAVVLGIGAIVIAIPAVSLMTTSVDSDYAARAIDLPPRFRVLLTTVNDWAPAIVLVAVALIAVGAALAMRAARGAGMSSKYRSPAARREELERKVFDDYERRKRAQAQGSGTVTASGQRDGASSDAGTSERLLWDSLDTGVDPTE